MVISIIGVSALSGCASDTAEQSVGPMSLLDRYEFEYIDSGKILNIDNKPFYESDCLENSPFNTHRRILSGDQASVSYDRDADLLTITARNGERLVLTGSAQLEHTLSPADEQSQQIFDAYDCVVEAYDIPRE